MRPPRVDPHWGTGSAATAHAHARLTVRVRGGYAAAVSAERQAHGTRSGGLSTVLS